MKILSFGEILFDVFGKESKIGGASYNFAAHAAGAGADSYLLSSVGIDALGFDAMQMAEHHGISLKYIRRSEKYATGVSMVTLDPRGIPSYKLSEPAAYDDIPFVEELSFDRFDGIYFGTLALRGEANRNAVRKILDLCKYREVFVDVNVREPFCKREALLLAAENASIIKISDEELPFVLRELFAIDPLSPRESALLLSEKYLNLKIIVITLGEAGSLAYDVGRGEFFECPAVKASVVSTVGAGDSYSATFFVNYLKGARICECMQKASEVSAYVVSKIEAIPEN